MKTKTTSSLAGLYMPLICALVFHASASVFGATVKYEVSKDGALQKLAVNDEELAFAGGGGFFAHDVVAKKAINLARGTITKSGGKTMFKSDGSDGLKLQAEFVPMDAGYVQVNGWIENATGADRAIILDYRLCLPPADNLVFSSDVNAGEDVVLSKKKGETEANAFPLAALGAPGKTAVSMAIPWNEPRTFGMVGADNSLTMRFYLGLSPLPRAFPNKASFSFIIFPSRADWGFRGSLERYYGFYPERYEPHTKDVGYYMYMVKGIVPDNVDQYSYNVLEMNSHHVQKDLDRDDKHKIASLVYTIVGQRELKFLPKIPANYDDAMKVYANWKLEDHSKFPITKENVASEGDIWLREEVENSAVKDPDGKFVLALRNIPWGKNAVSFKINPSPFIYEDKPAMRTVGKDTFGTIDKWLAQNPQIDGVIVDSLGANWPAVANYRKDHMEYVRYPLTFDPEGRLFIHNQTSHYEWVRAMHEKLAPQGKLNSANGVYAYQTSVAEHYRAKDRRTRIKVGRFFISSLLDTAASEAGTRARVDRCQDVRLMMGRKYYALTNYEWENKEPVDQFYNRALAFGIFASNTKNYFGGGEYIEHVHEGVEYVTNPQGYYRDKPLLDWFLPKARMLFKAGWEPATLARLTAGGDKVYMERFGKGNNIYFTVFNDSNAEVDVAIKLDLPSLGFTEGRGDIQELAYDGKLDMPEDDELRFKLGPYKTYIISLTKTWLWGGTRDANNESLLAKR